ncbi:hypothetical protein BCV69DRAFT_296973 [Microstroma glucosiphilum]|uniref:Uncharacterized protein n=1 Tax=Pseudomicrostroma glucosiphilum TaxID=1684307 RepID=A0A316UCQ2_9BASI|nr:hypothetical protein BCV69DRAFT_296973 [Pseudomicrostroma glucosiphilum]PWN23010.1 hypothetical protein BCV69DRAFT_296973 [Pseudomicrostroma glucosiphilum]
MSTSQNPSAIKDRHYAQLAGRLSALSQNVIDLHGHVELAAEHSQKTRVLAANQASLFMAANAQELDVPNRNAQEFQDDVTVRQ